MDTLSDIFSALATGDPYYGRKMRLQELAQQQDFNINDRRTRLMELMSPLEMQQAQANIGALQRQNTAFDEMQPITLAHAQATLAGLKDENATKEYLLDQQKKRDARAEARYNKIQKPVEDWLSGILDFLKPADAGTPHPAVTALAQLALPPTGMDSGSTPAALLGLPTPDAQTDPLAAVQQLAHRKAVAGLLGSPIVSAAMGPTGDTLGDFMRAAQNTSLAQTAADAARIKGKRDVTMARLKQILGSGVFTGSPSMQQAIAEHMQKLGIGSEAALSAASQDALDELLGDVQSRSLLMQQIDSGRFK